MRCSILQPNKALTIRAGSRTLSIMLKVPVWAAFLMVLCLNVQSLLSAPLQRWVYCAQNLWVDKNIDQLEALFQRAAKAGYTHVLLTDSKFSKLGDMDARYFRNIERVKKAAADAHLEIVPARSESH